jgi:predicted nucleic acid-binding protein
VKAAFDNSFLTLTINRRSAASVPKAVELVDDLIEKLEEKKAKVIIPAPTLTEVLLKAPKSGPTYIEKLKAYSCFQIKPFDEKAAIELAEVLIASIGKKRTKKDISKAKITFDRQIVAVAKAHGASEMYSADKQVVDCSRECGLEAFNFGDLKLTPRQEKFKYGAEQKSVAGPTKVQGSGSGPTEGQAGTERKSKS